jgi:hypothetical protein
VAKLRKAAAQYPVSRLRGWRGCILGNIGPGSAECCVTPDLHCAYCFLISILQIKYVPASLGE